MTAILTQASPGPWTTESDRFETHILGADFVGGSNTIASVYARSNGPDASEVQAANARLIAAAPEMRAALLLIDGEAPADEPRDGPTVGFQPSSDPEIDDGNEVVREAFQEGVARGLWIAANLARAALAKTEAQP